MKHADTNFIAIKPEMLDEFWHLKSPTNKRIFNALVVWIMLFFVMFTPTIG